MSNYYGRAINPSTGNTDYVTFVDNYYGPHKYGVKFPDGDIWKIEKVTVIEETPEEIDGWKIAKPSDPNAQQIVNGVWYTPILGCDSLQTALEQKERGKYEKK